MSAQRTERARPLALFLISLAPLKTLARAVSTTFTASVLFSLFCLFFSLPSRHFSEKIHFYVSFSRASWADFEFEIVTRAAESTLGAAQIFRSPQTLLKNHIRKHEQLTALLHRVLDAQRATVQLLETRRDKCLMRGKHLHRLGHLALGRVALVAVQALGQLVPEEARKTNNE